MESIQPTTAAPAPIQTDTAMLVSNYESGGNLGGNKFLSLDVSHWNWVVTICLTTAAIFSIYANKRILKEL